MGLLNDLLKLSANSQAKKWQARHDATLAHKSRDGKLEFRGFSVGDYVAVDPDSFDLDGTIRGVSQSGEYYLVDGERASSSGFALITKEQKLYYKAGPYIESIAFVLDDGTAIFMGNDESVRAVAVDGSQIARKKFDYTPDGFGLVDGVVFVYASTGYGIEILAYRIETGTFWKKAFELPEDDDSDEYDVTFSDGEFRIVAESGWALRLDIDGKRIK